MDLSKMTNKISSVLTGIKNTKAVNTAANHIKTVPSQNEKIISTLDALASSSKAAVHTPTFYSTNGKAVNLAYESLNSGLTKKEAINAAKEVMAATGMQDVPKSAAESAKFFEKYGSTPQEIYMTIDEFINKLSPEEIAKVVIKSPENGTKLMPYSNVDVSKLMKTHEDFFQALPDDALKAVLINTLNDSFKTELSKNVEKLDPVDTLKAGLTKFAEEAQKIKLADALNAERMQF